MLRLRALVLVTLGTPVMAALLSGSVVLTWRMWGTSLLDGGYWAGVATFGALSLVALALVLRVRRRVVEHGQGGPSAMLARFAPVLMLIGAIGGVIVAHFMADDALGNHQRFMESECRSFVGEGRPIEACLPVMEICDGEVRGTEGITVDRRGQLTVEWPEALPVPEGPRTRARHLCAWKALGGRR